MEQASRLTGAITAEEIIKLSNLLGGGELTLTLHAGRKGTEQPTDAEKTQTTPADEGNGAVTPGEDGTGLPNRMMTVLEVARHLGVARSSVDGYPFAVLPFTDVSSTHTRQHKRYDPRDVAALPARLRAWQEARHRGRGEEYLRDAERALRERDAEAVRRATTWAVAA